MKMIRLDCHLHEEGRGPKEFPYFFDEDWACPDEKEPWFVYVCKSIESESCLCMSCGYTVIIHDIPIIDLMKLS